MGHVQIVGLEPDLSVERIRELRENVILHWERLLQRDLVMDHLPEGWDLRIATSKKQNILSLSFEQEEVLRIERDTDLGLHDVMVPDAFSAGKERLLEFMCRVGVKLELAEQEKLASARQLRISRILQAIGDLPCDTRQK